MVPLLVSAVVDEVCAEPPSPSRKKHVVAVPLIEAEAHIETVGGLTVGVGIAKGAISPHHPHLELLR